LIKKRIYGLSTVHSSQERFSGSTTDPDSHISTDSFRDSTSDPIPVFRFSDLICNSYGCRFELLCPTCGGWNDLASHSVVDRLGSTEKSNTNPLWFPGLSIRMTWRIEIEARIFSSFTFENSLLYEQKAVVAVNSYNYLLKRWGVLSSARVKSIFGHVFMLGFH
jgi:hypothetical protein